MDLVEASEITLATVEKLRETLGEGFTIGNSVLVNIDVPGPALSYLAFRQDSGLSARNRTVIEYVGDLFKQFYKGGLAKSCSFVFQGDDCPVDRPSVAWQTKLTYQNVCLVPDFYYTRNLGYGDFLAHEAIGWELKETKFFWRGATTGGWFLTADTLPAIPRYKLCQAGASLGGLADFAFYNLVQFLNEEERTKADEILRSAGFLKPSVPLESYGRYKYFVQIDGNGNSWELIKKLKLGSCMLLVESDWQLWHNSRMKPWQHYVPIKTDLSDFTTVVEWCLANDTETKRIAQAAREFALGVDYGSEMSAAMQAVIAHCNNR